LHRYIFDQFNGLHLDMVNHFAQSIAIHTPRHVENYLAAITQVAPRLDEGINEARAAAAEGIMPPRVIIQRATEQIASGPSSCPVCLRFPVPGQAGSSARILAGPFKPELPRQVIRPSVPWADCLRPVSPVSRRFLPHWTACHPDAAARSDTIPCCRYAIRSYG